MIETLAHKVTGVTQKLHCYTLFAFAVELLVFFTEKYLGFAKR